jgi:DMSO/TMAO reductase YedYZ molybdopterin-dependent catalytic subunit
MKFSRRSFLKLFPALAIAVAAGSWWFFEQNSRGPAMSETLPTTSSSKAYGFPIAWNVREPPATNAIDYRLKIEGDLPNPLELTLDQLSAMPTIQETVKIECVEGWDAEVPWEGIPLSYLLIRSGASLDNVAEVTIEDVIGYSATLTAGEVKNWNNLIALRAGDAPLSKEHGYPARLVAPTRLGFDWIKCVGRITYKSK